jgi:hypothetical protein
MLKNQPPKGNPETSKKKHSKSDLVLARNRQKHPKNKSLLNH